MRKALLIAFSLSLGTALPGCGLKGDLYLPKPKEPAPTQSGPATPAATPAEETKEPPAG